MNLFKPLLAVLFAASPVLAQATIDVAGPQVVARDLADSVPAFASANPDAVLAHAPAPGVARRVSRIQLQSWAASLGLSPADGDLPNTLILRRRLRPMTPTEVQQAVRDALSADASVSPSGPIPQVPAGDLAIECLCDRTPLNQPTRLRLRWREPNGRSGIETVGAHITVQGQWLEAARNLAAGTQLAPNDAVVRSGVLPRLDSYLSIDQFDMRLSLMRSIKAGDPLTADIVRTLPLVSRGDLVELRFAAGGVRLRTAGRAEQSGGCGDVIAFRNVATGQRLAARIEDGQTAFVETAHAYR